ncbi:MAG: glutamine-hydrolyzing carbamoyl-phosphate synthase small subunit [Deltaproteobacteria bacterium]|nr:glutamine-hydrolyzing carbamoyl-phosphate synthase small subunit [Deltaproteobacteria bacterium]
MRHHKEAIIALADGKYWRGRLVGFEGKACGEVVFNTAMSGYQEILTDPSYTYQILTFTTPHIGNIGVNTDDIESSKVHIAGLVCREFCYHPSNFRATSTLHDYLVTNQVTGIEHIDTRELVLHIRDHGAQMAVIASGGFEPDDLIDEAKSLKSMDGLDLAKQVCCNQSYVWSQDQWRINQGYIEISDASSHPHVVVLDFGIKYNILRLLVSVGFRVTVLPGTSSARDILSHSPDCLFLSNGPGDPAAVSYAIEATKTLLGKLPIFGICLGHQILGLAIGLETYKLKFGHRGGNHPVRNLLNGKTEITVQNHGFAVRNDNNVKGVAISHVNLNDNTVEGLLLPESKAFSVQYHPESSPGPRDASNLFSEFYRMTVKK